MLLLTLIPLLLFDTVILYFLAKNRRFYKASLYFCLTRIIIIVVFVIAYADYVRFGSTFGPSGIIHILAPTSYSVLVGTTAFLMYRARIRTKLSLLTTVISIVGILCYTVLQLSLQNPSLQVGPIKNLNSAHGDNQTARDFQLLSQDIQGYLTEKNILPNTLLEAVNIRGSYSSEENTQSRLSNYTYRKQGTNKFQLCATFATDTSASDPEPGSKGVTQAYYHHSGYQCFDFDEY
jgi:hypothetical protein